MTSDCVSSHQHIFRLDSSLTGHSDIPTFPDIQGWLQLGLLGPQRCLDPTTPWHVSLCGYKISCTFSYKFTRHELPYGGFGHILNINEHLLFVHVSKFHCHGDLWDTLYLLMSEKAKIQILPNQKKQRQFGKSAILLLFFNPSFSTRWVVGLIYGGDEAFWLSSEVSVSGASTDILRLQ